MTNHVDVHAIQVEVDAAENACTQICKARTLCRVMFDDYLGLRSIIPAGCYDEDIEVLFSVQLDILDIALSIVEGVVGGLDEVCKKTEKESADKE